VTAAALPDDPPAPSAPRTARARARAELTREIKEAARRQLAEAGATGLSVRAVARELGMVSSAVYRYYPSRDELLTALIVDAYDAVGAAVEEADAEADDRARAEGLDVSSSLAARWAAIAGAVRDWARHHPNEYALIYGSPVPGYAAPVDTIAPAARPAVRFLAVVADGVTRGAVEPGASPQTSPRLAADLAALREQAGVAIPDAVLLRGLYVWTQLFGAITFELFGHLHNVIEDFDDLFRHHVEHSTAVLLGQRWSSPTIGAEA
jgi:AcrR family transcriptional regulator